MKINNPQKHQLDSLWKLWKEAFQDDDAFIEKFKSTAFSTDRSICVTVEEELVAALYWFDCSCGDSRLAYIYAIATAKAYRRRGICHKLMDHTHKHLSALGYEGAVLVPGSKALFSFYEKMGYEIFGNIGVISCRPSDDGAEMREIDGDEYARLRKHYLPGGSVVQENENLRFLRTFSYFYTGEGFVLAARREGDVLYGTELLGDQSAAPSIVKALKCTEGHFRTPAGNIPFAMYHSFKTGNASPPAYFGLAFD